ncbi:MAG TPA: phytoene/squalene synthase family protein [Gemmatimonadaceae bacterium]
MPAELRSLPSLGELAAPAAYMARHSRSFRFAAALLRGPERARVARVYAWCRFTDDLADREVANGDTAAARLDAWLACSRAAYDGRPSGIGLVDRVMGEMAEHRIPFAYAADLVAGVRSDVCFVPLRDQAALRVYTYRVAGVVGRWLTELHGVRDPWMLDRAAALGHAMQLTNILRDVGEDWDRGRVYLPLTALAEHGLTVHDVGALRRGARRIDAAYRGVVEDLMAIAARDYATAREAIPHLPGGFRRAVAVAAAVYEGIHGAIRRNHHDNVRRRAVTTTRRKVILAAGALWTLAHPPTLAAPVEHAVASPERS